VYRNTFLQDPLPKAGFEGQFPPSRRAGNTRAFKPACANHRATGPRERAARPGRQCHVNAKGVRDACAAA